jgi:hypothetical protein
MLLVMFICGIRAGWSRAETQRRKERTDLMWEMVLKSWREVLFHRAAALKNGAFFS